MGMLVQNDELVGGGVVNTSDKVVDKVTSKTVKQDIDTLKASLINKWIYKTATTGYGAVNYDNTINEICAVIHIAGSADDCINVIIPYATLGDSAKFFSSGRYENTSSNALVKIGADKNGAYLANCYKNGSNVVTSSTIEWYVR